jgi:TolB protein
MIAARTLLGVLAVLTVLALPAGSRSAPKAFPGKNGTIAFARFVDADVEIMAVDPLGRRVRQLIRHVGDAGEPSWSRDGSSIAFTSTVAQRTQGIYVARATGTRVRRITSHPFEPRTPILDAHPRWSPDGQTILFHRFRYPETFELYLVATNGRGRPRRIGEGFEPAWSPDGKTITFAWRRSGADERDLYVASADGSRRRLLVGGEANDAGPEWSPDGRRLAFVRQASLTNYDIWTVRADGTGARRLTSAPRADVSPTWSPDGKRIAFATRRDGPWAIYVMSADGSRERRLTPPGTTTDDAQPAWQPRPPKARSG